MKKLTIIILLLCTVTLSARNNPIYEKITLQAYNNHFVATNHLEKYYDLKPGLGAKISTPFYIGEIQANISMNYNSPKEASSSFYSIFALLEWNYPINIWNRLSIEPGFGLGNYLMYLDETKSSHKTESEICMGLSAEIEFNLTKNLLINCNFYRKEISTYHKIYLNEISIGIGYRLQTPKELKEILK